MFRTCCWTCFLPGQTVANVGLTNLYPGTKAETPLPPCSRGSMLQCLAWQGLGFCLRAYGKLWALCSKRYQPLPLSSRTGYTFPFSATKTSSCVDHTCTMNKKSYVLLVSFDPQDIPITSKFFFGTSSETLRKELSGLCLKANCLSKELVIHPWNFLSQQLTSNKPQRLRKLDMFLFFNHLSIVQNSKP